MSGFDITASTTVGVYLFNTSQNPVTVEAGVVVLNTSGDGYGIASAQPIPWTITNYGTLIGAVEASIFSDGILLQNSSGVISNATAGYIYGAHAGVYVYQPRTLTNYAITTLTNDGRIVGQTLAGAELLSASSVTNQSNGVILSGGDGVLAVGAGPTDILNAGSLIGSANVGAYLRSGGAVTNQAVGVIYGYRFGVVISGVGNIDNAGTIVSQATSAVSGAWLQGGGYLINRDGGLITSNYIGAVVATDTDAAIGTVVNQGSIYGARIGIQGTGPLTVTNTGQVMAGATEVSTGVQLNDGGVVSNTGAIFGNQFGVDVRNAGGTVLNQGSISSTDFQGGAGVALEDGGIVTNATGGQISSTWKGVQIGASLTQAIGGTVVNQGVILANDVLGDGAGVWLHGPGLIDNEAGGLISGGAFGVVAYYSGTTLINKGTIFGTERAFEAAHSGNTNRVIVYPSASFTGIVDANDTIGGTAVSVLELASASSAGTLSGLGTQFLNFGEVLVDSGATWSVGGTVVAGETVVLAGSSDVLTITDPVDFEGTLSGFTSGDTVTLAGISDAIGLSLGPDNVLSVLRSDSSAVTIQLAGSLAVSLAVTGGAAELTVPCFTAGTLIRTPQGDVAVETIQPGMAVTTASGETQPVIWVGRRQIDCTPHPRPRLVWPIHIDAHAFGPGLPERDLRVSPDHAIHVGGVLIPARRLVNGETIRQVPVDTVSYFHIELPRHDIILAEGLETESYLDIGDRSNFSNASPVGLFPDFSTPASNLAAVWEAEGYAPLVVHGPELEAVRARLASRVVRAA